MSNPDWKPCPYCGGNRLRFMTSQWRWVINCVDCDTNGPRSYGFDDKQTAVDRWNRRARVKCVHELVQEYSESVTADFKSAAPMSESNERKNDEN